MLDFHLVIGSGVLATKHFLPMLAVHEGDFSIGDPRSARVSRSAGRLHGVLLLSPATYVDCITPECSGDNTGWLLRCSADPNG